MLFQVLNLCKTITIKNCIFKAVKVNFIFIALFCTYSRLKKFKLKITKTVKYF